MRELNIIKENCIMGLKEAFEYKINLYFSLLVAIFDTVTSILILSLFVDIFSFLNLSFEEILFFVFLKQCGINFSWTFSKQGLGIFSSVVSGTFNSYLTRPCNTRFFHIFKGIKLRWSLIGIIYLILFTIFIIYYNLSIQKFLFTTLTSLLIFGYLFISILFFLDAFGFFKLKITPNKFAVLNLQLTSLPPNIYNEFSFKFIFLFFPLVLYIIPTLYYFGKVSLNYFILVLISALLLAILFNIFTSIMWKIGLKKYEAFS